MLKAERGEQDKNSARAESSQIGKILKNSTLIYLL